MESRVTRSKGQLPQHQEQQQRARWTGFLTKVLVDLMVDQVHRGNRKKNFFNRKAWKCICHEFYSKTGLKWDKEQLKNRYSVLRRHYAVVKSLLERNDFSWDQSTGTIVASDEVWSEYIQGHAGAETMRSSGCPLHKQLYSIFSEPRSAEFEGGVCSSLHCLEKPLSTTIHEDTSSESEKVDDDMMIQTFDLLLLVQLLSCSKGVERGWMMMPLLDLHALSTMVTTDTPLQTVSKSWMACKGSQNKSILQLWICSTTLMVEKLSCLPKVTKD